MVSRPHTPGDARTLDYVPPRNPLVLVRSSRGTSPGGLPLWTALPLGKFPWGLRTLVDPAGIAGRRFPRAILDERGRPVTPRGLSHARRRRVARAQVRPC